jgi:hypothetical protein
MQHLPFRPGYGFREQYHTNPENPSNMQNTDAYGPHSMKQPNLGHIEQGRGGKGQAKNGLLREKHRRLVCLISKDRISDSDLANRNRTICLISANGQAHSTPCGHA